VRLERIHAAVSAWYRPRRRTYAWRRGRRDPYRTLVSEVMLQQTQAARVEPLFEAFLRRFPDVGALAGGSRADVVRAWGGLGYNRRAVALHRAAETIVRDHGGRVPRHADDLRRLPGVGPYTASAVASIGFGEPVAAIDTNVRRIVARVQHGADPDLVPPAALAGSADRWLDRSAPADWNQAVMDLGREVCRPAPRCGICPLAAWCRFRASGAEPRPAARKQPPFEGSARQVRGSVVDVLRARRSAGVEDLAAATGHVPSRIGPAVEGLVRDGLVERLRSGRLRLRAR
jgi:A/G-specific adenine glycosylase